MKVLVDTSVWIDYFKSGTHSAALDRLIDDNQVVTNDLILAELVPFLIEKKQAHLAQLLRELQKIPMTIDWQQIIDFQVTCLKGGVNGVGIPDLLIAQNARQCQCKIYSLDKHFLLLNQVLRVERY
jgi:predicted nucleic acid-binding protein